jgi:hypothetical protein
MKNIHIVILLLFVSIILYLYLNKKESFDYCLNNDNINFIKEKDMCDVYETKLNNKITKVESENINVSYCIDNDYNIYSREQCGVNEMEVFMNR